MVNLYEGMRGGDLEDLILPLISVDEYESKIDEEAIVIAFYVAEHGAAEDLNRFLQRSAVELIDTEISPAPDAQGYYMVFIELLKNNMLPENVTAILEEVAPLANIENWKMHLRGQDDLVPFSEEEVRKAVIDPEEDNLSESVLTFLYPSDLTSASLSRGILTLGGGHETHKFEFVGFGELNEVMREQGLNEAAISMSMDDIAAGQNIAVLLGRGWSVNMMDRAYVVQHTNSDSVLVVRI